MIGFNANIVMGLYRTRAMLICLSAMVCLGSSLDSLDTLRIVQNLDNHSLQQFKVEAEVGETRYFLPKGRYYVTETLRLTSDTVLLGEGPQTELTTSSELNGEQFITNADWITGNTNIKLQGFKVEFAIERMPGDLPGVLRFENVKQLTLSDVSIKADTLYYPIDLSKNVVDAVVINCNIQNMGSGGCIQVRNRGPLSSQTCRQILISNNTLSSVNDEPVAVFGWQGRVEDVRIENNTITANGASFGIAAYGVDKEGHTGLLEKVTIRDNSITGSRHGAIAVKGGAKHIIVDNNRINDCGNDCVFLENGGSGLPAVSEVTIRGNNINNAGRHGIYAKGFNILVEGNQIQQCRGAGIFVSGRGGGRVDLLNNLIEKVGKSIILSGHKEGDVSGNQMEAPYEILRLE